MSKIKKGIRIILPEDSLEKKIINSYKTGKKLNIKLGFDPTSPDLHLGHAVVLKKLREFQDLGHKIFVIVGDFTTQIGDPTGKNKTRPALTSTEINKNAKTYVKQLSKILDIKKIKIVKNSKWFNKMRLHGVIKLMSSYNLGKMMMRDDFANRFKSESPIAMHEIIYPLLQGYDSLMISADIEIGGTDQLFNMQVGRHLQEHEELAPQTILCMPILRGLDGKKKMSKSLNNYIGLTDEPNDMFGKVMSLPDSLLEEYINLVTDWDDKTKMNYIAEITKTDNPMSIKKKIATNIVTQYHNEKLAILAEENFVNTFSNKEIDITKIEEIKISGDNSDLTSVLIENDFASSKSEVMRLLQGNGLKVNKKVINNPNQELQDGDIVQKGKKTFFKIKI